MTKKKSNHPAPLCDDGIALDEPAAAVVAASPLRTDEWSTRQRLRSLNREIRRPTAATTTPLNRIPHEPRRFDPPQNLFDQLELATAPARAALPPRSESVRTTTGLRGGAGQVVAWLIVAAGSISLAAGIGLIGWSLTANQMIYWNPALGLALGGQGTLIFGLVLVVSRLWRNSRHASSKLQDIHARLAQLQHTADALTAMRSGAPAFYADLVRGASPQMLLSNLKGQVDQLATRLGSGL